MLINRRSRYPVIAMLACYRPDASSHRGRAAETGRRLDDAVEGGHQRQAPIRGCCGSARRGADAEPDVNERHVARDGMAVPSFSNSSKSQVPNDGPADQGNNRADTATIGTSVAARDDAGGAAFRDRQRCSYALASCYYNRRSEGPN